VEGLLETTPAGPDARACTPTAGVMKKSKSLEVYLDAREDDDDGGGGGDGSACASAGDEAKKRGNFVDKCINKMRSLVTTAAGKRTPPDPKK